VRPRGKAGRKPGHNIIIWGQTKARWPNGAIPRPEAKPLSRACGARPSRGARSNGRWPSGESRELTRKLIFSEGRTLCVRVARPHECRGIPFAADGLRMSRWPRGQMPRSSRCPPSGRAEPAPPRRGEAQRGWPSGEGPEMTRKVIFSEGRGLRARKYGADANRGMSSRPTSWRETGGQKGADLVVGAMPSSAGVRSPPLQGG
jgi:hypothetical protein